MSSSNLSVGGSPNVDPSISSTPIPPARPKGRDIASNFFKQSLGVTFTQLKERKEGKKAEKLAIQTSVSSSSSSTASSSSSAPAISVKDIKDAQEKIQSRKNDPSKEVQNDIESDTESTNEQVTSSSSAFVPSFGWKAKPPAPPYHARNKQDVPLPARTKQDVPLLNRSKQPSPMPMYPKRQPSPMPYYPRNISNCVITGNHVIDTRVDVVVSGDTVSYSISDSSSSSASPAKKPLDMD